MAQERGPRARLREFVPKAEAVVGVVISAGVAGSGYVYYSTESKESFEKLPTTLMFYMQAASEAGIPPAVVLGAFAGMGITLTIDGVRKLRGHR